MVFTLDFIASDDWNYYAPRKDADWKGSSLELRVIAGGVSSGEKVANNCDLDLGKILEEFRQRGESALNPSAKKFNSTANKK